MTTEPETPRISLWKVLGPIAVVLALAIGALLLVRGQTEGQRSRGAEGFPEIREGALIPDLTLQKFGGGKTAISELKAKVLLINFWATWCDACTVEMPSIVELRKSYGSKGFEVAAIDVDENPQAVVPKMLPQLGIDFTTYIDPEGEIAELFDVHAIPLTVILDKNRRVLMMSAGGRNWNSTDMRYNVEKWLEAK